MLLVVEQFLNGLQFGLLLFLLAAGLTLVLGATLVLGIVLEMTALRHLYGRDHLDHVLATFGLILFFNEAVRLIWGPAGLALPLPAWLTVPVPILPGIHYPAYRLAIIVV